MKPCVALLLASSVVLGGCATRRLAKAEANPEPSWRTEEGRSQAQLEVVDSLLDSHAPEAALALIGQLRQDGMSGPELDVAHGRALRELGLLEDSQLVLAEAARRYPRRADVQSELGVLYMDLGQVEAAVATFQEAARLAPDDADVRNNLGFAQLTAGRPEEAVASLREAMRLDGTRIRTRNNLGYALVAAGREAEALRVFESASSPANAQYQLGLGLELRGDSDAARLAYDRALSHDPNLSSARQAIKRLDAAVSPSPGLSTGPTESP